MVIVAGNMMRPVKVQSWFIDVNPPFSPYRATVQRGGNFSGIPSMSDPERTSTAIAMVATNSERLPDLQSILAAAGVATESASAGQKWDRNSFVFQSQGGMVAVSLMPGPIPWSQLEGPCATAWWWPDAASAMSSHKFHFLVAVMGGEIEPVERRLILTRVVSAVLQSTDAAGVYWGEGTLVHEPNQFVSMADGADGTNIPGMLWLDIRIEATDGGAFRCFTTGMSPLGFREIEVEQSNLPPDELLGFIGDTATYIVNGRVTINDGATMGRTATEQYRVRFAPSMFDRGEVMRLVMA
jgi:hypothetical protein